GTEMEQRGKSEKPVAVDVITLELTPDEAEKLALATSEGRIQLALRNYNSTEQVVTRGATIPTLLSGQSTQAAQTAKPAVKKTGPSKAVVVAKQDPGYQVEILKGNEKTVRTFRSE
ncbi:MAG: Flp pilus assembly protein CpaB, partial [Nitrospirae bacterium]|nr:Flp pilus assembly protein CpaB [Nitrospirota bacterium]